MAPARRRSAPGSRSASASKAEGLSSTPGTPTTIVTYRPEPPGHLWAVLVEQPRTGLCRAEVFDPTIAPPRQVQNVITACRNACMGEMGCTGWVNLANPYCYASFLGCDTGCWAGYYLN